MIWREKRILLILLGALLLGNVVFFLTYRVQYQSRLDEMDDRLAQVEAQLAQAKAKRASAEQSLVAYRRVEKDVQSVLDEHWSTQPRRLTLFIAEVKRLAEASNAVPKTFSFNQAESEAETSSGAARGKKLPGVGAREVGVSFNVGATYQEVRRFINLLELSDQFVIIDQLALSEGEENRLNFTLRLKTLFREEPTAGEGNRL